MSAPASTPPAGGAPEPAPEELTEFFCYECESSVSLPLAAAHPFARRPPCPVCRGNFLEPGPSPFPDEPGPPPPLPAVLPGYEDSDVPMDEQDELDDMEMVNPVDARLYITRLIQDRLYNVAAPEDIDAATDAALSLLENHMLGGEPPAPAASVAELPVVAMSDPEASCPVCLEEYPLASPALKLPCSHIFHSGCILAWLQRHNTCPMCRSRLPLPLDDPVEASPPEQDLQTTITIRLTTTRRRVRVNNGAMSAEAPVSSSPTQLAEAGTGEGGGGPASSGDTVSSEWPQQPESDTDMSEPRDGDGFFD